jgi:hypothetical protein
MFITAYKRTGENNWLGYKAADNLGAARVDLHKIAERDDVQMAAIFPEHHWHYGLVTCKPGYLIDKTDRTNAPICGLGDLIDSRDSSWF